MEKKCLYFTDTKTVNMEKKRWYFIETKIVDMEKKCLCFNDTKAIRNTRPRHARDDRRADERNNV